MKVTLFISQKKKLKPSVKFQFQTGSVAAGAISPAESSEIHPSDISKENNNKEQKLFSNLRAKTQTNLGEQVDI